MSEKTLFLLKPDALTVSQRTEFAQKDFFKQLQDNELSIVLSATFVMTYDMLVGYQPVLDPVYKSEMTLEWRQKTIDYQVGPDHKGKEHRLIIVKGPDALAKGPTIKRYIRNKYCSPWYKYAPANLIHAPDDNEEYESDLSVFQTVIKSLRANFNMQILHNTRRKK